MNFFSKEALKKFVYSTSSIFAGIFLFITVFTFGTENIIFNPSFHKYLFEKENLYRHVQKFIDISLSDYINNIKQTYTKNSANQDNQNQLFDAIKKSVTSEMIDNNLNILRRGLLKYFTGEKSYLPDIYLGDISSITTSPNSLNLEAINALEKIKKINLSTLLLCINRRDISDCFFAIKFIYFTINICLSFSFLSVLFLCLIALVICRKPRSIINWIKICIRYFSLSTLICTILMLFVTYFKIPKNIYPISMSLPISQETILSYTEFCTMTLSFFTITTNIILLCLSILLPKIPKSLYVNLYIQKPSPNIQTPQTILLRYSFYAIFALFITSTIGYKINTFKNDFLSNDFKAEINNFRNMANIKQVIAAKNDTIYTLGIIMVDKKTGSPISDITINVSGKSEITDKYLNEADKTDSTGISKFNLEKGAYRLSFFAPHDPFEYQIPTSYFLELNSPGTSFYTIRLNPNPELEKQKPGLAEIEVLDKDNLPLSYIELNLSEKTNSSSDINKLLYPSIDNSHENLIYSYTNLDGIAVFKKNEGKYKITFSQDKFPHNYSIPKEFEVNITGNSIARYTIKLTDIPRKAFNN